MLVLRKRAKQESDSSRACTPQKSEAEDNEDTDFGSSKSDESIVIRVFTPTSTPQKREKRKYSCNFR